MLKNRIKVSANFYLDEFVSEEIYSAFGSKSIIFVSKERIRRAEELRKIYGPIIINNWAWVTSDELHNCGYRTPNCKTGAFYSQHKLNTADDFHFTKLNGKGITAYDEIRQDIIQAPAKFIDLEITTIESGTWSWLHADYRNTTGIVPDGEIYVVPFS